MDINEFMSRGMTGGSGGGYTTGQGMNESGGGYSQQPQQATNNTDWFNQGQGGYNPQQPTDPQQQGGFNQDWQAAAQDFLGQMRQGQGQGQQPNYGGYSLSSPQMSNSQQQPDYGGYSLSGPQMSNTQADPYNTSPLNMAGYQNKGSNDLGQQAATQAYQGGMPPGGRYTVDTPWQSFKPNVFGERGANLAFQELTNLDSSPEKLYQAFGPAGGWRPATELAKGLMPDAPGAYEQVLNKAYEMGARDPAQDFQPFRYQGNWNIAARPRTGGNAQSAFFQAPNVPPPAPSSYGSNRAPVRATGGGGPPGPGASIGAGLSPFRDKLVSSSAGQNMYADTNGRLYPSAQPGAGGMATGLGALGLAGVPGTGQGYYNGSTGNYSGYPQAYGPAYAPNVPPPAVNLVGPASVAQQIASAGRAGPTIPGAIPTRPLQLPPMIQAGLPEAIARLLRGNR